MELKFILSFLEGHFSVQTFVLFLFLVFLFLFVSFFRKTNRLVWVCFSTFLCFIRFCSDLKVVFKRIIYPVLSWF